MKLPPEPELQRLYELSIADRDHPDYSSTRAYRRSTTTPSSPFYRRTAPRLSGSTGCMSGWA